MTCRQINKRTVLIHNFSLWKLHRLSGASKYRQQLRPANYFNNNNKFFIYTVKNSISKAGINGRTVKITF